MNRSMMGALLAVVVLSVLPAAAEVGVGDRPTLRFKSIQGQRVTSEMLRGRLVVVDFWATWCGPCVAAMPDMLELQREYGDKGVQIIGISLDSNRASVERFVQEHRVPWPQYFDGRGWKNQYAQQWGVNSIPRVFLIGPGGTVLWTGHPSRFDAALEAALREHPPTVTGAGDAPAMAPAVPDEVVEQAVAALQSAREAVRADGVATMLGHVAAVPEEAVAAERVVRQTRLLLRTLRQPGVDLAALKAARDEAPDADARLEALIAAAAPRAAEMGVMVLAAPSAPRRPQPSPQVVAAKLKQAEQARERDQPYRAYGLYQWVVEHAADTAAGVAAAERLAAYEADAQIMQRVRAAQAEDDARSILAMAESYRRADKPDLARELYRKLLDRFGDTDCAAKAKAELAAMQQ